MVAQSALTVQILKCDTLGNEVEFRRRKDAFDWNEQVMSAVR